MKLFRVKFLILNYVLSPYPIFSTMESIPFHCSYVMCAFYVLTCSVHTYTNHVIEFPLYQNGHKIFKLSFIYNIFRKNLKKIYAFKFLGYHLKYFPYDVLNVAIKACNHVHKTF
jgi:hypothetical protein